MNFCKFTIKITLAIAATVGVQSIAHASTSRDTVANFIGIGKAQPQRVHLAQSEFSQAEDLVTNLEGQTFFSRPPQLVQAVSSQAGIDTPSTYNFTLTVPEDAGQPLQAVTIAQAPNLETVRFDINNSHAFLGDRVAAGLEIPLASVGNEQPVSSGEVTVVFAQPVQPGSTVTVAVPVQRNPNWGGVYEFGITAYPAGENGVGQFLGYGRINFYGNSD